MLMKMHSKRCMYRYRAKSTNIYNILVDGIDITHTQFLQELHTTYEQYILSLCSTLKKSKLLLKRNLKDICINANMKDMIMPWQTNHDIQCLLDACSCVMYICDYMTKVQKGMRTLMAVAGKEAKECNMILK